MLEMEGANDEVVRIDGNPPLRTMDNGILQELSVYSVYLHSTKKGLAVTEDELKTAGKELIEYLQKEYDLE